MIDKGFQIVKLVVVDHFSVGLEVGMAKLALVCDMEENVPLDGMNDHLEETTKADINASQFRSDIFRSATEYIHIFFKDKTFLNFQKVTKEDFLSKDDVSLVVNTSISEGAMLFYQAYEEEVATSNFDENDDIILFMAILQECSQRGIPKKFASGIAILYMRHCAKLPRKMKISA